MLLNKEVLLLAGNANKTHIYLILKTGIIMVDKLLPFSILAINLLTYNY